jgi:hypothetical protein
MRFAVRKIGLKYSNCNIIREKSHIFDHFLNITIALGTDKEQMSSLT